jgi:hypothetical protein
MLLGDMIAKVTSAFGVKPCPPCKARQASLNKWHAEHTGRAGLIQSIQCPACKNFAWTDFMQPAIDITGHPHHPSCPVIANTFVMDVKTG